MEPLAHRDSARLPAAAKEYVFIENGGEISDELKRFRKLIAQNREERLRLKKNLQKVTRQIARTTARAKNALKQTRAGAPSENLASLYTRLFEIFDTVESRSPSARKCLDRLTIRCESCAAREMTPAEHATQVEGIRFEYLLLLKSQGIDEQQLEKYADIEELISLLNAALQISG